MSEFDAIVEGSLNWSFLTAADLEPLAELVAVLAYFDDPIEHRTLADLVDDYGRGEAHAGTVGRDKGGTIVAYASNRVEITEQGPQVWMSTGVHPAWRHKRIARKLINWSIDAAKQWHAQSPVANLPLWMGYLLDDKFTGLRRAVGEFGFEPQRYFFDMHRPLGEDPLPDLSVPEGIRIVRYEPWMSSHVRDVLNEVVTTMAGGSPIEQDAWEASLTRPEGHPELSWVAIADDTSLRHSCPRHGDIIGFAMNAVLREGSGPRAFTEGWTERLGVCPNWQGMGIGLSLLVHSMHSFDEAGLDSAGLGADTDKPTDADNLREACGFIAQDQVILYGQTFPPVAPASR